MLSRRDALLALGAALGPPRLFAANRPAADQVLLAWQSDNAYGVGVLELGSRQAKIRHQLAVPTRAHGLLAEAGGSVLAVARRPGDWLLRWHPVSGRTQWHWSGEERRFNGHVAADGPARALWTTETDLETAQGRLVRRDARSLEVLDVWATQSMDPHALLRLSQPLAGLPVGAMLVANGGIPTLPETGRTRRTAERMDASLVALDPVDGQVLGQWRVADPFLSLRHVAWDPVSASLGIALQAEHGQPAERAAAPVLAVFDGHRLRLAQGQPPLAGYGGDICALPGGGFAVSCPRANTVALFDAQGVWRHGLALREACALVSDVSRWLAAGVDQPAWSTGEVPATEAATAWPRGLQPDNHGAWWSGG